MITNLKYLTLPGWGGGFVFWLRHDSSDSILIIDSYHQPRMVVHLQDLCTFTISELCDSVFLSCAIY